MIGEEEQQKIEPEPQEPVAGPDESDSSARADPLSEEVTRAEFEAAWSGLGAEASAKIAEELARVAARDREPSSVRRASSSQPPPPPAAKAPQSLPPVPAAKLEAQPIVVVETDSGEPDLLALSRSYVPSTPAEIVPLPAPVPQVVTVVQQVSSRSMMERNLLVTLVLLLVAINAYFLATRDRSGAPEPARAAEVQAPEPAIEAPATDDTMQVRPAAAMLPTPPLTPTPTPEPEPTAPAPVEIPAPAPSPPPDAPIEEPLVIEPDAAAEPAAEPEVPKSPPRAAPRPRKPRPKPPTSSGPLPDKRPPLSSPVEEPSGDPPG